MPESEDLRTNGEITIRKEISNCVFYFLFIKTSVTIIDTFYPYRSLLWGNLVNKLGKSDLKTEFVFVRLLRLLILYVNISLEIFH